MGLFRSKRLTFDDWYRAGLDAGFTGPAICYTHDGMPTSPREDFEFDEGNDPCVHILRLYVDDEHRESVEGNHSPSQWRRPRY